jgi:hypothetical protein
MVAGMRRRSQATEQVQVSQWEDARMEAAEKLLPVRMRMAIQLDDPG